MSQTAKQASSRSTDALLLSRASDGCNLVHKALERTGMNVGRSILEPAALIVTVEARPSAVFLDARHEVGPAARLCTSLRAVEALTTVQVVAVTRSRDVAARTRMYEAGADDCWTFVENPEQLRRRAMEFVRPRPAASPPRTLRLGGVALDPGRYTISCWGRTVELTVLQLKLLSCLLERPGMVFSYQQLLDEVWANSNGDERMVRAAIVRLRRVLGRDSGIIRTVRGGGYMFKDPRGQD